MKYQTIDRKTYEDAMWRFVEAMGLSAADVSSFKAKADAFAPYVEFVVVTRDENGKPVHVEGHPHELAVRTHKVQVHTKSEPRVYQNTETK